MHNLNYRQTKTQSAKATAVQQRKLEKQVSLAQQWRSKKLQRGFLETQVDLLAAEIYLHATRGSSFRSLRYKVEKKIKEWRITEVESAPEVRTRRCHCNHCRPLYRYVGSRPLK